MSIAKAKTKVEEKYKVHCIKCWFTFGPKDGEDIPEVYCA